MPLHPSQPRSGPEQALAQPPPRDEVCQAPGGQEQVRKPHKQHQGLFPRTCMVPLPPSTPTSSFLSKKNRETDRGAWLWETTISRSSPGAQSEGSEEGQVKGGGA